jgi:hypothetical protein
VLFVVMLSLLVVLFVVVARLSLFVMLFVMLMMVMDTPV